MLLQCSLTLTCSQNLGPNTGAKMRHKGLSMDTIVHLVLRGVKYKCLSVVGNEKKYFSRVYHSDVRWKWVNMGTPAPKLTLSWEHIKEHLRTTEASEATPQNPINSHHKWNQPMTHLSHLGKNQCCTSWYVGWNLGMCNVGMDYQYWRTNQLGMTWATASLIPVPDWAGTWGNTRYIPTLYQCRYQVHTCHIQGTNVCIAICKMCFSFHMQRL
jgi:hypothetical protein